ncbi:hypothetical protein KDL45_05250 [bacterium]|nr:hypothetical protein [bacterium]
MMKRRHSLVVLALCGLMILMTIGANECQPVPAPFNASGEYMGAWTSGGDTCDLDATLSMNSAPALPPVWGGNGTFTFDLSCIEWPDELPPLGSVTSTIPGALDEAGNLNYAGVVCGTPYCITFAVNGKGVDVDDDNLMDTYDGTYSLSFAFAGFPPATASGQFELDRVEDNE